ncbi:DUF6522 family protein [Sedimentitalea todarodis]|uniref:DUF6522 family protein n=1 Tax=Sedimentitalea todarodis TaxID=1631240 RepID=A0ABU3VDU3_9RHOB|nr:DUF6522 family protein [Sedimentitalea todarodis]MDU9004342.1 DUF6522 family protein [Sedimentitalea todarodis]
MTRVEISQDGFVVDAEVIAKAFKLEPENIQPLMRSGEITSLSETGIGEDAGRARLTFHYGDRTVRLVISQTGTILKRVSFPSRSRKPIASEMFPLPSEPKS